MGSCLLDRTLKSLMRFAQLRELVLSEWQQQQILVPIQSSDLSQHLLGD